jgi:HEAT repeats
MRLLFRSIVFASLIATCPIVSLSYPAKPFSLTVLVGDSDVVAVADLHSVRQVSEDTITVDGHVVASAVYRAEVEIETRIKGLCPDHIAIEFYTPEEFVGYPGVATGRGLVFLKEHGPTFVFTDRHFPLLPAADTFAFPNERGPVEGAAAVLGRVLSSPATSQSDKTLVLIRARGIPETESFMSSLHLALNTVTAQDLRCRIQAELIFRGDSSQVAAAVDLLLASSLSAGDRDTLLLAIGNYASGSSSLPALTKLLHSGDPPARRAAAEAFWHIASPASLGALGPSLQDVDEEVRFYVVRAISDIANEPEWGGPGESEFREHQQKYLSHWQDWVSAKAPL